MRRGHCNKAHHWSRFCCDSFFSRIVLRSFRHCFRTICRTEMADIETNTKDDSNSSQVKFPLVSMSASWVLVSMYLIWILESKSIEQPIKRNSVGSGNMSHCKTPSFNDHLDHCFVVFKHILQSFLSFITSIRL